MNRVKPPYFGAAYYPEDWPEKEIDADIALMKKAGMNVMRIGEFAWSRMEPREGRYDFEWLHAVVKHPAASRGASLRNPAKPRTPFLPVAASYAVVALATEAESHRASWRRRVNKLGKADIAVILGTPTAVPPAWLTNKHPETLMMTDQGMRAQHGARRHACPKAAYSRNQTVCSAARCAASAPHRGALQSARLYLSRKDLRKNVSCFNGTIYSND